MEKILDDTDTLVLIFLLERAEEDWRYQAKRYGGGSIALSNVVDDKEALKALISKLKKYVSKESEIEEGHIADYELCSYYRDYLEGNI